MSYSQEEADLLKEVEKLKAEVARMREAVQDISEDLNSMEVKNGPPSNLANWRRAAHIILREALSTTDTGWLERRDLETEARVCDKIATALDLSPRASNTRDLAQMVRDRARECREKAGMES